MADPQWHKGYETHQEGNRHSSKGSKRPIPLVKIRGLCRNAALVPFTQRYTKFNVYTSWPQISFWSAWWSGMLHISLIMPDFIISASKSSKDNLVSCQINAVAVYLPILAMRNWPSSLLLSQYKTRTSWRDSLSPAKMACIPFRLLELVHALSQMLP